MRLTMTSVAILCLLLLERFLVSDMDTITEPVLDGLRSLEKTAMTFTRTVIPGGIMRSNRKFSKFFLFTPQSRTEGKKLDFKDRRSFQNFNPRLDTKVIIHGFLDKAKIAKWMHQMKDEFLMLGKFNVILVDWSVGNFLPYTQAAANTAQAGEETAKLLAILINDYGAKPNQFHLIGHSLGSHVSGYVGERIKGIKRITGLDPAMYLFKEKSPRERLDSSDAEFVDVLHTDAGGIGVIEPMGHIDFYPNGGEIQPGCTASNSLKTLLEHGIMEGVRNMICSHMRGSYLFIHSINSRQCQMIGYKCSSWESFSNGQCDFCGFYGENCAVMGYHIDTHRNYGNGSKFFLVTSKKAPFCVFEYKITLFLDKADEEIIRSNSTRKKKEWSNMDVLHVLVYGSNGNAEFKIEGQKHGFQNIHIVHSSSFLGDVYGAVLRWEKKPLSRAKGVMDVVTKVIKADSKRPLIRRMELFPLKTFTQWQIVPITFELCCSRDASGNDNQQGAMFSSEYC